MRRRNDIGDTIMGIVIWLVIIATIIGIVGVYWFAVAAALTGALGFAAAKLLPRIATWRANRKPCPHGIKGGQQLDLCTICVATKRNEQELLRRQHEAKAEQARIHQAAKDLTNSEAARLLKIVVPSLADLHQLTPQRFEDEMARLFERLGYEVQQTPYSNDLGRDAILKKGGKKFLLECKRYAETNSVGRPELQKFHSAVVSDGAISGFFVTTGTFTTAAREHATKLGITPIDGTELLRYLIKSKPSTPDDDSYSAMCTVCGVTVRHSLRARKPLPCPGGHSVKPTLDIDGLLGQRGASPECARCGKPMKLVNGKNGRFWGCSQYPQCRSSRPWRARL